VVHYYELSDGRPVPSNPSAELRGSFRDVAVTADGRHLVFAHLSQDHQVFPVGWSSPTSVYRTDRYPNAVALGAGDLVAAGVETDFGRGNDVYVHPWGAETAAWTYRFGPNADGTRFLRLADRGLAWAPGNRRLYAVSVYSDGTSPRLHTLVPPPTPPAG
jgi:hypothetical protein